MRAKVTATLALSCLLVSCARPAEAADPVPKCRFVHGFAEMKAVLGDLIGDCREDERSDPATGDAYQRTARGLLVWRRNDGLIGFTDGARSWVRGPNGAIYVRPNYERFAWEGPAPTPGCAPARTSGLL